MKMSIKELIMKKLIVGISIFALAFTAQATTASMSVEKSNLNDLQVMLESDVDVYGLQFDLNYDASQLQLTETNITHLFTGSDVRSNMSVYSKIKEPGLARVIMFDLGGNAILSANNLEKVLQVSYENVDSFKGATSVTINNIVAAGAHGEGIVIDESIEFTFDLADETPYQTSIVGNYPNPFNPTTTIEFDLAKSGVVDVTIYDLQGRKVANLFNGNLEAAQGYTFNWDASNVASGQYFGRISAPGFSDVLNMTLLK
jgi:hypothetical protein